MGSVLNVLLIFYCVLLLSNAGISFYLWWRTKEELFKLTLPIWGFTFFNFFLQGLFQEPGILLLLAFGSYIFVSISFYYFARVMKEKPIRWNNNTFFFSGLFIILSCISWEVLQNFYISAMLMSIAVSIPMFETTYFLLKNQKTSQVETRIFAFLLFVNALHFLDFPFLRFAENGAVVGYSAALFLLFLLSVFIPMYVVQKNGTRYSALLEKEVVRQTKELREISHYNNALLNIVSHDLASPMMVLELATELLFKKDLASLDQNSLDHAKRKIRLALSSLEDTLEKVRTLQAVRNGKQAINLTKITSDEIIEEVELLFEDRLKAKNIKLEIYKDSDGSFLADKSLLKNQVIANIISNAIKFSPEGATIKVNFNCYGTGELMCITVKDQGIGIPPEILNNLFSFGAKTNRMGTNNEKGTGFGLPLVKACLELMDGNIIVESKIQNQNSEAVGENVENDFGSTFKILLKKAS